MIRISEEPINVSKVVERATSMGAGALNVFVGTVRDTALDRKVVRLEYEAYDSMAVAETQKIMDEATQRWGLLGWAVSHRVGTLVPGDIAVVVAVATKHRKASFEACEFIIDTMKQRVPIFKKEVFEDGAEWISARPASSPPASK